MKEREKVIIVGGGGREHALGWRISQSPGSPQLFFIPGNAGTEQMGSNLDIDPAETDRIIKTARDKNAFVVVGQEAPLGKGIVNAAKENKVMIFGPTQEAALLETSKSWAIDFMQRHNISHPASRVIVDLPAAMRFLDESVWKEIVIKADGLAAGKGVFLPSSKGEASVVLKRIFNKEFDDGSKVIFQERLKGKEVSLLALTDGKEIVPLLPTQDYKRLEDGDEGPNTGGIGAFAPTPMNSKLLRKVYNSILRPTVDGMREEGNLFQGVLYLGLMLTTDGPKVLEFNVRFGDPETQPLMLLFKSDLLLALKNTAGGNLKKSDVVFRQGASMCVVLAAEGYPGKPTTGDEIYGLDGIADPDIQLFHAGTALDNNRKIVTNGGRIIGVTSYGENREDARRKLDPHIGEKGIHFRGMHYRKDIGF